MDVDLLDALRHLPQARVNLAGLKWLEDHVTSDHVEALGALDLAMLIHTVALLLHVDRILAKKVFFVTAHVLINLVLIKICVALRPLEFLSFLLVLELRHDELISLVYSLFSSFFHWFLFDQLARIEWLWKLALLLSLLDELLLVLLGAFSHEVHKRLGPHQWWTIITMTLLLSTLAGIVGRILGADPVLVLHRSIRVARVIDLHFEALLEDLIV